MLGVNIKMGLARSGMTINELAESINKQRATVSRWCNNHTTPSHADQLAICEVFNVEHTKFLEWHK